MSLVKKKRILIIKFGGLGDFILSLYAMSYIKDHHAKDEISILTENLYFELAQKSRLFERIYTIKRNFFYFFDRLEIKKKININSFHIIYDLQTSKRSSSYYSLFNKKNVKWSGIVKNNQYFHSNINRDNIHTLERQKDQLKQANIKSFKKPNFDWLFDNKLYLKMKKPFALVVPGGSAKRKYKRIPKDFFVKIVNYLNKKLITPILIGSDDEIDLCKFISSKSDNVINKCCKLNILEIAYLSKNAFIVIGNDTGTMHLSALSGSKTIVIFTKFSNPELCSPIGKKVEILFYRKNENELFRKLSKAIS